MPQKGAHVVGVVNVPEVMMFGQSYRGTLAWLAIVGAALGVVILSGNVPATIAVMLLGAYIGVGWLALRGAPPVALADVLPRAERHDEATEAAREAAARARLHPDYDSLVRLLDIGLIVDEQRPDGVLLRRGRFVSLDDDGVRPFARVYVPEGLAGRLGRIRFELRDDEDRVQYVYEDEKWLQAGENVLLPDYRLPLRKKADTLRAGNWSAFLRVDGGLVGVHTFNLALPLATFRPTPGDDGEIPSDWVEYDDANDMLPLSLEELLRSYDHTSDV